jgi:hypothetical protein
MNSIQDTVREYEESCERLQSRVDQLSGDILILRRNGEWAGARELEARRYQLYDELTHMEDSLADMRDYLAATTLTDKARANRVLRGKYA